MKYGEYLGNQIFDTRRKNESVQIDTAFRLGITRQHVTSWDNRIISFVINLNKNNVDVTNIEKAKIKKLIKTFPIPLGISHFKSFISCHENKPPNEPAAAETIQVKTTVGIALSRYRKTQ
mgnify:CR=1 FL=1